jgi:hypothetical protein
MDTPRLRDSPADDDTADATVSVRSDASLADARRHFVRSLARLAASRMFVDALAETKLDLVDPT